MCIKHMCEMFHLNADWLCLKRCY